MIACKTSTQDIPSLQTYTESYSPRFEETPCTLLLRRGIPSRACKKKSECWSLRPKYRAQLASECAVGVSPAAVSTGQILLKATYINVCPSFACKEEIL
jgi:hypothetical protein